MLDSGCRIDGREKGVFRSCFTIMTFSFVAEYFFSFHFFFSSFPSLAMLSYLTFLFCDMLLYFFALRFILTMVLFLSPLRFFPLFLFSFFPMTLIISVISFWLGAGYVVMVLDDLQVIMGVAIFFTLGSEGDELGSE